MTTQPVPVVGRPTYSSIFSFVFLMLSGGAGYFTFALYGNGASDELKYAGLVSAIAAAVLCYVLLTRSLRKVGLTMWGLRSVKMCVGASIFQTAVACIYLYTALHLGFTNGMFQKPIIYTVITCIIAIHGYMLYANIQQTKLIFLSLTISVWELVASIVAVMVVILYIIAKNTNVQGSNSSSETRMGQRTIGGFGTYNAYVTIKRLPRKVSRIILFDGPVSRLFDGLAASASGAL